MFGEETNPTKLEEPEYCEEFLNFLPQLRLGQMQSTTNYLWLISDLLGQGATANVYRGRHKVGSRSHDLWLGHANLT